MKKSSSKKGFSLIELIVVIAVIAAIAAVIVPSIGNFSKEAKVTADKRNVQLWNQTYQEALAAGAIDNTVAAGTYVSADNTIDEINVSTTVGSTDVRFTAQKVTLQAGTVDKPTTPGVALNYTETTKKTD